MAERVAAERVADEVLVAVAVAELVTGVVEVAAFDVVALATDENVALEVALPTADAVALAVKVAPADAAKLALAVAVRVAVADVVRVKVAATVLVDAPPPPQSPKDGWQPVPQKRVVVPQNPLEPQQQGVTPLHPPVHIGSITPQAVTWASVGNSRCQERKRTQ